MAEAGRPVAADVMPPEVMPAAVYVGDRSVTLREVPVPRPGPGQVLVEVSHCGICGTDLHLVMDGWGRPGSVLGHEYSGTVVATGPGVDDRRPGDRVVGGPGPGCGRCRPCGEDRSNLCQHRHDFVGADSDGAFARFKAVEAVATFPLPASLDLRTAALCEPLAVAVHTTGRVPLAPGDPVLVSGAGPIGLLCAAVLVAAGSSDVTVIEPSEDRRRLAGRAGARTVHPDELEQPGSATDLVERPYRAAFECSGRPEAMEACLANLDRGGTLVLAGTGMKRPRLDPNRMILHELSVTGAIDYTPSEYTRALELLATGGIPVGDLIDPVDRSLAEVQEAMEQLSEGRVAGKVMVAPGA